MTLAHLFWIMLKAGLWSIGGGLASLPIQQQELIKAGVVTKAEFGNMLGVAQSLPGPIGINVAAYAGYESHGVLGVIVAVGAFLLPSLVCIILIAKFLRRFDEVPVVKFTLGVMRVVALGLIAAATWSIFSTVAYHHQVIDWLALLLTGLFLVLMFKTKLHVVHYLILGALAGLLFF